MSYEQFWKDKPELYWAYQTAFFNKVKFEQEIENNISWLRGLYVYKAFNTVEYNVNKRQNDPQENYYEKPIDFNIHKDVKIKTEQEKFEDRMKAFIESKKITLDMKKGK